MRFNKEVDLNNILKAGIDRMVYDLNAKYADRQASPTPDHFAFMPETFVFKQMCVGMYGLTEEERKIVEGE